MPQTINLGPCGCCGGGDPTCEYCSPDTPQASYFVQNLSGVTNGTCTDCDDYNTDPIELVYVSECRWEATEFTGGCSGGTPTLVINSDGSATLTIGGATYDVDPFDCEGENEFTLTSAGTDCDDWPATITVTVGLVDGCFNCFAGAPSQFTFTPSGITDGSCTDCENLNTTFIVTYHTSCVWRSDEFEVCGTTTNNRWFLRDDGVVVRLEVEFGGAVMGAWVLPVEEFVCLGANVMVLDATSSDCSNWPDTITVSPA